MQPSYSSINGHSLNPVPKIRLYPGIIHIFFLVIIFFNFHSCIFSTDDNNRPNLKVSTSLIEFGSSVTEKTLSIQNTAGGSLKWEIFIPNKDTWCTTNYINGTGDATIKVIVKRSGLHGGDYETYIKIDSNGGSINIHVTMKINATGDILFHISLPEKE